MCDASDAPGMAGVPMDRSITDKNNDSNKLPLITKSPPMMITFIRL